MRRKSREMEIVADLAGRQHGVVAREQLLGAGIAAGWIDRRLADGLLQRVYRGVYRVGHSARHVRATYLAAVRACGDGALLSGRAAGHLHGLLVGSPPPPEVTAPGWRRIPGVRCRQSPDCWRDAAVAEGIPVTSVARTLVDLAGQLDDEALGWAVHRAATRHDVTIEHVQPVLARRPRGRGAGALRRIMVGDGEIFLSKLEKEFSRKLRARGHDAPETNRRVGSHYVDCRWPRFKVTVELDGYRFHRTRRAWEQDRRREREAYARGDEFRRYTWGDVFEHPEGMYRELDSLLQV